ncbi:TetR/AcrR family transcriptional regulator [Nonomuraea rhodomycinica]|uniref:TetR/AcrR family transcriptional regulator n=1 Tax=Nonomuraea rhodomycinica TaxID=1712872 RepID=A0A7Y6IXZ1_9ACTN|nr:TetR/AcrR family transcriptional regulator [Nonomuraea rhodomycinica]NUW46086.1 TetR/AcrR family transcriptional regulator [Nonomuraea rhodomycinica]
MASKGEWLEAGLAIATRDGIRALTIERLCADLGLTKGSFYHHFKGIRGYKSDLLTHIEAEHTGRFIAGAEAAGASGHDKIQRLLDLVLEAHSDSRDQETAVRAWARQDSEVRAFQERVDAMRVDYLRSLWLELGGRPEEADGMATLLYLILVGAQQVVPPLPAEDLRAVYALAMRSAAPR